MAPPVGERHISVPFPTSVLCVRVPGRILSCLRVCSSHGHRGMQILAQNEAFLEPCRESLGEAIGDESPSLVLGKKILFSSTVTKEEIEKSFVEQSTFHLKNPGKIK